MSDGRTRWSQAIRRPGAVIIAGHHATDVPPISSSAPGELGLDGLRLLVHPVGATPPIFALDVTSSAARAMLSGFLESGIAIGKKLSWETRGFGTRRRDTIKINWRD